MQKEIHDYISELINNDKMKSLLNEFKPKDDNPNPCYSKQKGIYAFFLKPEFEFFNLGFNENDNEIKDIKQRFDSTNKNYSNNLLYIGKTCSSFQNRVLGSGGHMQGGVTNLAGKIFSYLTGFKRTLYGKTYVKENIKSKDNYRDLIEDDVIIYKNLIMAWFRKYIDVKFYEVKECKNQDMVISIIEESLISIYQPALNDIGVPKKNDNCVCN